MLSVSSQCVVCLWEVCRMVGTLSPEYERHLVLLYISAGGFSLLLLIMTSGYD